MNKRRFHLCDVLSVTTGCMVSARGIEGIYDILNFMTGESLFTHQLPRAARVVRPALLERFPALARVEKPMFLFPDDMSPADREKAVAIWVKDQAEALGVGSDLELEPLTAGLYEPMHPLAELSVMRGPK